MITAVIVVLGTTACGGSSPPPTPPLPAQREVAARFATALLTGDEAAARSLLLRPDEPAILFLVKRATDAWKPRRVSIQPPRRETGERWSFRYAGSRSFRDGRFVRENGRLIVVLVPSASGARVRYFSFANVRTRFSTHHDGQLLPSKR
jgi:hypothetical protein